MVKDVQPDRCNNQWWVKFSIKDERGNFLDTNCKNTPLGPFGFTCYYKPLDHLMKPI